MNATPCVVLLAEDEPSDLELVRRALVASALPFDLHHVADGRQLCERWIACRVAASGKASGAA